jgi:hypothetical protein
MRDLFLEDGADMLKEPELRRPDAAEEIRDALTGRHVCPFCGMVKDQAEAPCPRCTMENTAASRQATKARIGPWYVLQTRNPAAPGMKFETLLAFVRKGKIKARSIVRGPTTHQLWRFAAHVRGLSREFGICYSCGGEIEHTANLCPHCNRLQEPPAHPDVFLESQEHEAAPHPLFREVRPEAPLVGQDIAMPSRADAPSADGRQTSPADPVRQRRPADGFLSPRDLAAAFKLNFTPKDAPRGRTATAGDANRTQRDAPRMKSRTRRHRRWKRWVALLLILAGGGAFAFQYHRDPNFRAQTLIWYQRSNTWVRQKIASLQENANRAAHPAPMAGAAKPQVMPAPQPQFQAQPPAASQGSPWDQILKPTDSATTSVPTAKPAQQEPANTDTSATSADPQGTLDEARSLYRSAIDDEDKGDFKAAVKKYEQIHKFSHDLWPQDLELRLREARDRLH